MARVGNGQYSSLLADVPYGDNADAWPDSWETSAEMQVVAVRHGREEFDTQPLGVTARSSYVHSYRCCLRKPAIRIVPSTNTSTVEYPLFSSPEPSIMARWTQ